jgi:hypothetical protein
MLADWARSARYPEQIAKQALRHNAEAVHRTYAKRAVVKVPSNYQNGVEQKAIPFPLSPRTASVLPPTR